MLPAVAVVALDEVTVAELVFVADVFDTVVTGDVEAVLAVDCVTVVSVVVVAGAVLMVVPTRYRILA